MSVEGPTIWRSTESITAAGIYHGNLDFESTSDDLIDGAQLLPYPIMASSPSLSPTRQNTASSTVPISMSLTEFHFLLLYRDRVLGISNLNEQLAYEELLPLVSYLTLCGTLGGFSRFEYIRNRTSKSEVSPPTLYARHIGCTLTSQ